MGPVERADNVTEEAAVAEKSDGSGQQPPAQKIETAPPGKRSEVKVEIIVHHHGDVDKGVLHEVAPRINTASNTLLLHALTNRHPELTFAIETSMEVRRVGTNK